MTEVRARLLTSTIGALVSLALACPGAGAQGVEIPAEDQQRFRALDRDGDGLLGPGEFPGTPAELAAADRNGDGKVSLAEAWGHAHTQGQPGEDLGASFKRAQGLVQELLGGHDIEEVIGALRQIEAAIAAGRTEDARAALSGVLRELEAIKRGEPSELLCRTALHRLEKVARVHEALDHDLSKFHAARGAISPAVAAEDWRAARTAMERAAGELNALNDGDRQDPTRINTDGFEAEPTVSGDGTALYFQYSPRYLFKSSTPRQGPDRTGMTFADTGPDNNRIGVRTFRSVWDGERWGPPEVQAFPNEARDTERPVFGCVVIGIAPDDLRASLIEYRTRGTRGEIALADREPDGRWGAYRLWGRVNTEHTDEDGHFDLVPGSSRIYFLSDRPGGKGGADIYYVEDDRIFSLDGPVNTADGEWFPQPDAFGNLYYTRGALYVTTSAGEEHAIDLGGRGPLPAMAPAITRDGGLLFYRMPVRVLDVASDADSDIFFSVRAGPEPWAWSRPYPVEDRTRAHGERGLVHAAAYALARVLSTLEAHPDLACADEARTLAREAERLLRADTHAKGFQEAFRAWSLIATEAPQRVLMDGRAADDNLAQRAEPYVLGFACPAALPKREPKRERQLLDALGLASDREYFEAVMGHMKALSAPMVRAEFFYAGGGRFVGPGELYAAMEEQGYEVCAAINPLAPFEALDAEFEEGLASLAKKHPKFTVWQVGNEPDLLWENPSSFPAFFVRAQRVLRAAHPQGRIVLAGISNQYDTSDKSYQRYDRFLAEIAKADIGPRPFDIFDFHYYKEPPRWEEIEGTVRAYRDLLSKHGFDKDMPIWCTETGAYTGDPPGPDFGPHTEAGQARDLARITVWMCAAGVRRVFCFTVIEGWGCVGIPGYFDQMGLVFNGLGEQAKRGATGGTKKKAYHTYGRLAVALRGTTTASRVAPGVYRFDREAGPVFVVWDEAGDGNVEVPGLNGDSVRVEALVPDDQGGTATTDIEVAGGKATVPVDAMPRLLTIEPR